MDRLISSIRGQSGSASDLSDLNAQLATHQTEQLLRQNAAALLEVARDLDAEHHSLGLLYLLEVRGRVAATAPGGDAAFLREASSFLRACSAQQVQLAPAKFASLCRQVKASALADGCPKLAIAPLRAAIPKIAPCPGHLTPAHADLLQCAILSKCYNSVAGVLEADVCTVDPKRTACTATDLLLYCYYGGTVEVARRRYGAAAELLHAAVCAPTAVVNAITVACLKRLVLVEALRSGEVLALPKWAPAPVARAAKAECGAYFDLARKAAAVVPPPPPPAPPAASAAAGAGWSVGEGGAGGGGKPGRVHGAAAATAAAAPGGGEAALAALASFALSKAPEFEADGNAGLARLVVEAASRRRLAALPHTFAALPLGAAAARAGLADAGEAELAVLRMVDAGQLSASLSDRDATVAFPEDARGGGDDALPGSGPLAARIDVLIERCMALAEQLQEADAVVSTDRAFLSKMELRGQGSVRAATAAALRAPGGDDSSEGLGLLPPGLGGPAAMDVQGMEPSQGDGGTETPPEAEPFGLA